MSDGLTSPDLQPSATPRPRVLSRAVLVQVAVIVVAYAVVGALLGLLWYHLWDVPSGTVSGHRWYTDEAGLRDTFQGTGWYVALGAGAGLVLGVASAWFLDRSELATLGAVVLGSVLAGLLMYLVGTHLSPADPQHLAKTAKDGTRLDGQLSVQGWSPKAAVPFGSLLGVVLVYFLTSRRRPEEVGTEAVRTSPTGPDERGFGTGTGG